MAPEAGDTSHATTPRTQSLLEDIHHHQYHNTSGIHHNVDEDGRPKRTGTLWTASAHIVTAVIGSGVLSLPWTMSKLGWIAGSIAFIAFAFITGFTSVLLANCYRVNYSTSNHHCNVVAKRNYTYREAVRSNLGEQQTKYCEVAQYGTFVGAGIGYTITASISMVEIYRSNCLHSHGDDSLCKIPTYPFIIAFGLVQVILSQIPNLAKVSWLSIVAAVMSFSYSSIAVGLSISKLLDSGNHPSSTVEDVFSSGDLFNDVWIILQAIGNIAFAYSYSSVLIEIQDTIRSPPDETKTMKKASFIAVSITTMFYMLCGCIGYAAFGSEAPGNLLSGFGMFEPYWLVDVANAFVVVHLVGAFQVFVQPLYAFFDEYGSTRRWVTLFINKEYTRDISGLHIKINFYRFVVRTTFVFLTSLIAIIFPFFNDILGVIGAIAFWPLTIYFPIRMYIAQKQTMKWTLKWCALQAIIAVCFVVSLGVLVASVRSLILNSKKYKPF